MIPKDKIHDVLFAADLKEVAENCGLKLKRAGAVLYKACCPFHDEKDGSFFVNTKTNRWHCYGCDRSGNAIDLLMEKKGLSFPEAVKLLAAEHGITIEERQPTKEEEQKERERRGQLAIYEAAARFYQQKLQETSEALKYAIGRFNEESIKNFRIGYAPRERSALYHHLRQKGFLIETLEKCDLFREWKDRSIHDFFRDRIMFPIFDPKGDVVAFSGRALHPSDDTPKYINSFMSLKVEDYIDLDTHGMFICSVTEARVVSDKETMTYTYYQNNVKPKPQTDGKKGWVCKVCGYVYEGEDLPEDFICPLCKHGVADFEPIE